MESIAEKKQFSGACVKHKITMLMRVGSQMVFKRDFNMDNEETDWLMADYANCICADGRIVLIG